LRFKVALNSFLSDNINYFICIGISFLIRIGLPATKQKGGTILAYVMPITATTPSPIVTPDNSVSKGNQQKSPILTDEFFGWREPLQRLHPWKHITARCQGCRVIIFWANKTVNYRLKIRLPTEKKTAVPSKYYLRPPVPVNQGPLVQQTACCQKCNIAT